MKSNLWFYVILGALLVTAGVGLLVQSNNLLPGVSLDSQFSKTFWSIMYALGGVFFLVTFLTDMRKRWGAIIPALPLLALAGLVVFASQLGVLGGGLFLGASGLAFLAVFLVRREYWGALIPAGSLLTLAVVASLSQALVGAGVLLGAIFFLGLALTFLVIYLVPSPTERQKWAIFPAIGCAALAFVVLAIPTNRFRENADWLGYGGPALLVAGGILALYKALSSRRRRAA